MLGYITKKEALALGFTHHGSYFGIPIWISDDYIPMVAAKWEPMEHLITAVNYIEGFMRSMMNEEPGFEFFFGKRIE